MLVGIIVLEWAVELACFGVFRVIVLHKRIEIFDVERCVFTSNFCLLPV